MGISAQRGLQCHLGCQGRQAPLRRVPGRWLWSRRLCPSSGEGGGLADKTWTSVFSSFGDHARPMLFSGIITMIKNCILRQLVARVPGNNNGLYFLCTLGCPSFSSFQGESVKAGLRGSFRISERKEVLGELTEWRIRSRNQKGPRRERLLGRARMQGACRRSGRQRRHLSRGVPEQGLARGTEALLTVSNQKLKQTVPEVQGFTLQRLLCCKTRGGGVVAKPFIYLSE